MISAMLKTLRVQVDDVVFVKLQPSEDPDNPETLNKWVPLTLTLLSARFFCSVGHFFSRVLATAKSNRG